MDNTKTDASLPDKPVLQQSSKNSGDYLPWVAEGVAFPHGTEFRGKYKGYLYRGIVNNGAFILNGKKFLSPCAAAVTITRDPVEGWLFWDCKIPGRSSWVSIYEFKNARYSKDSLAH